MWSGKNNFFERRQESVDDLWTGGVKGPEDGEKVKIERRAEGITIDFLL